MKKIIISVLIILLSLISFTDSFADSATNLYPSMAKKPDNSMYKLYKQAILTRHQIQVDYKDWVKMNKDIENFFISLYFKTDRTVRLRKLEKKTSDLIKNYDNKILNMKQKKVLNLIKNLYYRSVIELNK